MTTFTDEDLHAFIESVGGSTRRVWPEPQSAGAEDALGPRLTQVWEVAGHQGWIALEVPGELSPILGAVRSLGHLACPLPLLDSAVTGWVLGEHPEVRDRIHRAEIRPVVAWTTSDSGNDDRPATLVRCVEAAPAATHVLMISAQGRADLHEITNTTPTPGMAVPPWSDVTLNPQAECSVPIDSAKQEDLCSLLRLGLVARALAAARASVELSIQWAKQRHAFGRPIGSYQAVAHRAVDAVTALMAADALVDQAVSAFSTQSPDRVLDTLIATEYGRTAAIEGQFSAHHTLAAVGYFDEHPAPWLFRRVHADVARIKSFPLSGGGITDRLVATERSIPRLRLGADAEEFRTKIRGLLAPISEGAAVTHIGDEVSSRFVEVAREHGLLSLAWPRWAGGAEAPLEQQVALGEEIAYHRIPPEPKSAADLLGTALIAFGTEEQRARLLPPIASGKFAYYLGYSEPEIGSDLAALRTKAVRDGDDWVIDGQKMWGTGAQQADWVWLAVRTDPAAEPPHAGITVFLTRTDRPGWEFHQHRALSGEISCSTFFEGFRVPDSDRVGPVNDGWRVISSSLMQERMLMANTAASMLRLVDDLLAEARIDPVASLGEPGSATRGRLDSLLAEVQAARALVYRAVRASTTGQGAALLEAPMAKILSSQLMERLSVEALDIFGPTAALGVGVDGVPGRGAIEYSLRLSIMYMVGGGTIDIQRNLVARALGLPRPR